MIFQNSAKLQVFSNIMNFMACKFLEKKYFCFENAYLHGEITHRDSKKDFFSPPKIR